LSSKEASSLYARQYSPSAGRKAPKRLYQPIPPPKLEGRLWFGRSHLHYEQEEGPAFSCKTYLWEFKPDEYNHIGSWWLR